MNTRCPCGHVRDWHYDGIARCAVTACGCKEFRTVAAPERCACGDELRPCGDLRCYSCDPPEGGAS